MARFKALLMARRGAPSSSPRGAAMGCALWWVCMLCLTMPAGVREAFAQEPDEPSSVLHEMAAHADALRPLVSTQCAEAFLDAAARLPDIEPRTVYIKGRGFMAEALTPEQFERLPEPEREGFEPRTFDARFYYYTRYGSPLIYTRPIELACRELDQPLGELRILDFGYGMIGQLRILASLGADVVGIDVQPQLTALYSQPGDTGAIENIDAEGESGSITLVEGSYPGDPRVREQTGARFDLILSKNVLKRGYIHPERPTEYPTIGLGVDDETFVRAWFEALAPGGLVMIYNISPKQNPDGQPFLPWADGRCPFERALLEAAGFEVLAYDADDFEAILDLWRAVGLAGETPRDELAQDLFAKYTLLLRPL